MILLGAAGFLLALFLLRRVYRKKKFYMFMPLTSQIGASMVMMYNGFRLLTA